MLHCDLRVRWKVTSDLRFQTAISEPKTPSFCGISGDLAPSTRKSLAIAIVRFWCATDNMLEDGKDMAEEGTGITPESEGDIQDSRTRTWAQVAKPCWGKGDAVCAKLPVYMGPSMNSQPLSEYGFAYGLKTETRQFSTNFSCEPHGEGKEKCLCPSTDRVRFRLFPSTVWAGGEYGLDWFRARFRYPRRWERVREPHAKQYSDSALNSVGLSVRNPSPNQHCIRQHWGRAEEPGIAQEPSQIDRNFCSFLEVHFCLLVLLGQENF